MWGSQTASIRRWDAAMRPPRHPGRWTSRPYRKGMTPAPPGPSQGRLKALPVQAQEAPLGQLDGEQGGRQAQNRRQTEPEEHLEDIGLSTLKTRVQEGEDRPGF